MPAKKKTAKKKTVAKKKTAKKAKASRKIVIIDCCATSASMTMIR